MISLARRFLVAGFAIGLVATSQADDATPTDTSPNVWSEKPLPQTEGFGLSPFYGYRFGGSVADPATGTEYSFADSPAYGLTLDYGQDKSDVRLEVLWSHQDSSLDFHGSGGLGKTGLTIDVCQVGGIVEFGSPRLREYLSCHLGATHFATDDLGSDTHFSVGIGVGVKAFLTKNIYLRLDLRGFCNVVSGEGSFIYYNGITIANFSGSSLWQGQVSAGFGITF